MGIGDKPIVNNFLYCLSLEAGGKIIAYLSIVGGVLLTISKEEI